VFYAARSNLCFHHGFSQRVVARRLVRGDRKFLPAACSHQQHGDEEYFLTHLHVGLRAHLLPQLNRFAIHCDAFGSDLVLGLLMLVAGDRDGTSDLELIFW